MRICFLADASENTASYAGPFRQMGHEVALITLREPISALKEPWVHYLAVRGKWEYLLKLREVTKRLLEFRPDLVVGYRLTSYGLLAVLTGFHPLVVTTTGFDVLWDSGLTRRLRRRIVRYVLSRADLCVSWEEHLTVALPTKGLGIEVLTVPRGVSLKTFTPGEIPPAARPPIVISTRTLKKWYRVDLLLRAFSRVLAAVPGSRLYIVGDGPERPALQSLAGSLGLQESVAFLGRLTSDRVAELLRGSSVYATQISFDGVSASLLEAMATGVFPVVPDNPANRLWLNHGDGGFLYPAGDENRLTECLVIALTDGDLRTAAAARNAAVVSQRGDRAANLRKIERRFCEILENAKRPVRMT